MKNLTKKALVRRQKHHGLNDLLSYLMLLNDNTILHKDGAISRHFCYAAPDLDSSTDIELDYHANTWKNNFELLGNGWMVETNVLSHFFADYNKPHEFPDCVSALIDDERRIQYQGGQYFKTTYYLSITWRPERLIEAKLRRFAVTEGEDAFDKTLSAFDKQIAAYIGYLKRSLKSIRPLEGNELTTYLYQCITGGNQTLAKPFVGCFLDCYLAGEDFIGGFSPKIGNRFIKALTLDDLPAYSYPGILDTLSFFPIEYRWSSRFICLDKQTARAYLKRYERSWSSKAIGILGVIRESLGMPIKPDEDAQQTADQLKTAQVENSSGSLGYGFYNSVLILMHEDREILDDVSQQIAERIQQMDFKIRAENVNACEAYLGSIPCHGDYNLRKMLLDTQFAGHAFPTSSVYQGEITAPCQMTGYKNQPPLLFTATRGSRPFMLNLHIGDVGHTAVLGPTGSGKTTLNAMIMAGHRKYPGSRVIVLDKDYSNRLTVKALGGSYFDLAKNECQLAPLARLEDSYHIDKAVEWLTGCCSVQNISMTPEKQRLLREAVERLAKDEQQYKNLDHLSIQDSTLRTAIGVFNAGSFKELLGGTKAAFLGNDVIGIDMGALIRTDLESYDLSIPVIKAVFNELEALFGDKRPTLLILEEAWLYLRHRLFREKLTDWFKTLRKANVSVIFVSQDLDDIVKSQAASVIQTSCMTRIYLPNKSAGEKNVKAHYEAFGLNERQIQIIQTAMPKKDYYYQSPMGNRIFRLDLNPIALAFLCISQKRDIQKFEELFGSKNWVLDWLDYKNLSDWRQFAQQQYFT